MGSLLPLWKFQFDPMRSHAVCDVQWNPHYQDLFAVAYGSCKTCLLSPMARVSKMFREGMGSLLPLWKFQFHPMRSHAVCDVQWNPHYQDLFAVAYGSCE
ncbi:hypothetical protein PYW07_005753 [Mythimna separata]|uniref:Uncharacterized protein n=1 Tax=Mythimna separata TaxID=271217 RepID=A0AAD8DQZ2_MYTSE|nr:hypothetical protein PYW07_005753 [Mythimna separata]